VGYTLVKDYHTDCGGFCGAPAYDVVVQHEVGPFQCYYVQVIIDCDVLFDYYVDPHTAIVGLQI